MTEAEFVATYAQTASSLLRYAAFVLGSRAEAEDVTAEAFARLLERGDRVPAGKREAWLFAVARNLCRDAQRRGRRVVPGEPTERAATAEEPVWSDERLRARARRLTPAQQQVLFLRVFEVLPFAECGRLLGCSEGAARVRYHRAIHGLRAYLEEVPGCETSIETT